MDIEAERQQLESQKLALENYLQHPVTKEFLRRSDEEQEALLARIVLEPPTSVEAFFFREQAIGELRRLRSLKSMVRENLDETIDRLKELDEQQYGH